MDRTKRNHQRPISESRKKACRNNEVGMRSDIDSIESFPCTVMEDIVVQRSTYVEPVATNNIERLVSDCLAPDTDQLSYLRQVECDDSILDLLYFDELDTADYKQSKMNKNTKIKCQQKLSESNENPTIARTLHRKRSDKTCVGEPTREMNESADYDRMFLDALFRLAVSLKQSEASRLELLLQCGINIANFKEQCIGSLELCSDGTTVVSMITTEEGMGMVEDRDNL